MEMCFVCMFSRGKAYVCTWEDLWWTDNWAILIHYNVQMYFNSLVLACIDHGVFTAICTTSKVIWGEGFASCCLN